MAVAFDSSATKSVGFAASATTGTATATHTASTIAPNLCAIAAVYWAGDVNATGATFAVTFGGQSMTEVTSGQVFWNSNQTCVTLFYLASPPTGAQTVTATFTGMSTGSLARILQLASVTYSGVASVGTATTASGASASLTVPSTVATMFVNAFGCYGPTNATSFSSYSQTSRSSIASATAVNEPLIIGDASGSGPIVFTATAPSPDEWAGVGVGLIGAAPAYDATGTSHSGYVTSATSAITVGTSATALITAVHTYRNAPATTVTAGGTAMQLLGSVSYAVASTAAAATVSLYGLLNPPTGSVNVVVTNTTKSYTAVNSVSYTGVSSFDTAATNTYVNDVVTVASVLPAHRVIAAHAITPMVNTFTYNQLKRAVVIDPYSTAEQTLLVGDAPGAPTVTSAVTLSSGTPNWGAIGVNLTPAPVAGSATVTIPVSVVATAALTRTQPPSPLRYWTINGPAAPLN